MTAQLVRILAAIAASQARVAAMQAKNIERLCSEKSIAYGEEAFLDEADLLEKLSIEATDAA